MPTANSPQSGQLRSLTSPPGPSIPSSDRPSPHPPGRGPPPPDDVPIFLFPSSPLSCSRTLLQGRHCHSGAQCPPPAPFPVTSIQLSSPVRTWTSLRVPGTRQGFRLLRAGANMAPAAQGHPLRPPFFACLAPPIRDGRRNKCCEPCG